MKEIKILRVEKFDSRPTKYRVTLEGSEGHELKVLCTITGLWTPGRFRKAMFEQTNVLLPTIEPEAWRTLLGEVKVEVIGVPSKELR